MRFLLAILLLAAVPANAQSPREARGETTLVTVRALLSVSGPEASADTYVAVRAGPGANAEIVAQSDGPVLETELTPGNYVAEARSGLVTRRERVRVRAGGRSQTVRVNLNAGVLAVRSRSAARMVLMEPEPDVFGEQAVLAEMEGQTWALTAPQGRYRLLIEGLRGRVILDQDVEIVPARREIVTTR